MTADVVYANARANVVFAAVVRLRELWVANRGSSVVAMAACCCGFCRRTSGLRLVSSDVVAKHASNGKREKGDFD